MKSRASRQSPHVPIPGAPLLSDKAHRSLVLNMGSMIVNTNTDSIVIPSWERYVTELGKLDALTAKALEPWLSEEEVYYAKRAVKQQSILIRDMKELLNKESL